MKIVKQKVAKATFMRLNYDLLFTLPSRRLVVYPKVIFKYDFCSAELSYKLPGSIHIHV